MHVVKQADKALERRLAEAAKARNALAAAQKQLEDAAAAKQETEAMARQLWCADDPD